MNQNPDRTVYVSNLDKLTPASEVRKIFERCGPIKSFRPIGRTAFVEYTNRESADHAARTLNEYKLGKAKLRVTKSPKVASSEPTVASAAVAASNGPGVDGVNEKSSGGTEPAAPSMAASAQHDDQLHRHKQKLQQQAQQDDDEQRRIAEADEAADKRRRDELERRRAYHHRPAPPQAVDERSKRQSEEQQRLREAEAEKRRKEELERKKQQAVDEAQQALATQIKVSKLDEQMNEDKLRSLFGRHGQITSLLLARNDAGNRYALLDFAQPAQAAEALSAHNPPLPGGIRVTIVKPPPPPPPPAELRPLTPPAPAAPPSPLASRRAAADAPYAAPSHQQAWDGWQDEPSQADELDMRLHDDRRWPGLGGDTRDLRGGGDTRDLRGSRDGRDSRDASGRQYYADEQLEADDRDDQQRYGHGLLRPADLADDRRDAADRDRRFDRQRYEREFELRAEREARQLEAMVLREQRQRQQQLERDYEQLGDTDRHNDMLRQEQSRLQQLESQLRQASLESQQRLQRDHQQQQQPEKQQRRAREPAAAEMPAAAEPIEAPPQPAASSRQKATVSPAEQLARAAGRRDELRGELDLLEAQLEALDAPDAPPTGVGELEKLQKESRRIAELLMQTMLKLDAVQADGDPDIRARRKLQVQAVNAVINECDTISHELQHRIETMADQAADAHAQAADS
eukprot:TRINITY_DN819_c0_g1_i1.p1 TRINITY_DN819_c0_g1~~TRINITY_DN819_c0_g1_i1.p1  ORF type:complete len:687 (-),score=232.24 TRINITY_DN819_c0_g1_i1:124-2184(-)